MSELITRRTFLKATGAAALVAAAGSMLVGCGEGYGATPGNPTLPTIDTLNYKGLSSYSVGRAHSAALLNQILCMNVTDVVTIISTPPLVFRV